MAPKNVFRQWKLYALLLLAFTLLSITQQASAQNEVAIGSATTKSNAILWLNGNGSQGLILPVVTNKSAVSNPDKGMILYDDSDGKVWYRNTSAWVEVGGGGGSTSNLNLAIQGNQLLLRDGTSALSTVNIAGGAPTAGSFMVFQGGSWQAAGGGDVTASGGALQITGLRGKSMANLPATSQVLAYDPAANSNTGGWVFQPFSATSGVTNVSGTAPILVANPATTPVVSIANGGITNTLLADNAVTAAKIQDGTITGADIANTTITTDKLAQSGAAANQVLQWNGTNWVPNTIAASGTVTQVSTGTGLTGGPITETGTISIDAGGVGSTELADNAVSTTKIADNAVTTAKINAAAVDNTKLADNSVNSAKIDDGTVTGTDIAATTITGANIANTTITANKFAQSGAFVGEVLKWNGTNWVPQPDDIGSLPVLTAGQLITNNGTNDIAVTMGGDATFSGTGGLTIANNAITTAKIANTAVDATKLADNSVTSVKIAANAVDNTKLADNAVNSAKIVDGSVTGTDIASATITGANITNATITTDKLAQSGAAANQVLQWNGTNWGPGNALTTTLNSAQILVGNASNVATPATVSGDGALTNTGVLTISNGAINSAKIADGSITGADVAASTLIGANIANTTITADKLAQSGASVGQVLKWNGTNWVAQTDDTGVPLPTLTTGQLLTNNGTINLGVTMSGDATFNGTGALTIASNAITTAKIANAAIDGTKLADNAVTTTKINANAVDATKIADNAVTTAKIAAAAVDDTRLADNAVTTAKIADNAVTSTEIADGTITGADIAGTTITADKLAQSGATNDQVLQWNGTNWVPSSLPASGDWSLTGNAGTDPASNFLGTSDLQGFSIRTNNSERIRIASNGFVGFGIDPDSYSTTNDAAHIELARTGQHIRFRMTSSFTHRPAIQINATDGTDTRGWSIYRHNNTDGSLIIQANDGINGVNGEIVAMNLEFATGNVGIKKALADLPTEALDVAGNVRFSGALMPNNLPGTAGQVLTSQGPGVAPVWSSGGGSGWGLLGNAGTTSSNFIGTTDANPLYIRVNNQPSGRIDHSNGINSTFFGFRAGRITTGQANVAVGWNAMEFNTGGEFNTAIGYQALKDNTTAGGNTAVGRSALFTQSANISDNSNNTAIGHRTLYNNQPTNTDNGDENTALGFEAGLANTTGRRNTYIGALAGSTSPATLENATAIGYNAQVSANNTVRIGNTSITGIFATVGITTTSDRRLKSNIEDIAFGIDFIQRLRPVSYKLNNSDERESWGFVAQDIEELLGTDKAVLTIGQDNDRALGLRYTDFIAPMVKAIQEQQQEIEDLKSRLKEKDDIVITLQTSVNSMKDELETIKRALGMEANLKPSPKQ